MIIEKRRSCPCRCNRRACQARRTLPQHPSWYRNPVKCHACGKGIMRPDNYRAFVNGVRKENHGKVCDPVKTGCDGYSYPHHWGRGWCKFNPKITPEQLQERHESGKWT